MGPTHELTKNLKVLDEFLAFIHIKTTANILTKCKEDHRSCRRNF